MLDKVKMAMNISVTAYDAELTTLIEAAFKDLRIAGINTPKNDVLVQLAVITYCRYHFGNPDNYANLKASYDEQKSQLQMARGYRDD